MCNPADDGVAEHILLKRRVASMAHPACWEDYLEWQGYQVKRGPVWGRMPYMGGWPPERTSGWPKKKPLSEREKRRIMNSWRKRVRTNLDPHLDEFIAMAFSKEGEDERPNR